MSNTASKVHASSSKNKTNGFRQAHSKPKNMFNDLPSLSAPTQKELHDELDQYLSTNLEMVEDVLMWWHEHWGMYPCLLCMVLYYLMIPGRLSSSFDT
jgi:hAT family C-terminal dimerisation region